MVIHIVECPRCWRAKWHATGRFNTNRHGLRRAELICDVCSYSFSSGRPEAITAGERVLADRGEPIAQPVYVPAPTLPYASIRQPTDMGSLAKDWKQKQLGEDE